MKPLQPQTQLTFIGAFAGRWTLLLGLATVLCVSATHAAPKKNAAKPAPPASAPVQLGNNIFLLGEEAEVAPKSLPRKAPRQTPSKAVPKPNLNALLLNFCRSYLGRKLGNGQCSELVMLGLPAIGAQCDLSRQWGMPICNYGAINGRQFIQVGEAGKNRRNPHKLDVRPGDIIQYENVKFERRWNGGYSFREYPHHTSVIERVSRDGRTYHVLEQNVNGTQYVLRTALYLPDLTQGTLHITRPTP